eukprot:TRINITY_DN480_c2_g1_i1.p1 TRINITY_DN480_c2_g1~~TRINITY_DN480_c2_g1_i1.p1  ORF type:complete len:632 (+),score=62.41 TRINITY_DN480_c2_g1_i1:285-1898(+)
MAESDKQTVRLLFDSGAIQVLVATAPMCWGMTSTAHCVLILGTQFYDAIGTPSNDYSVLDLLQMMGRASRPQKDEQGVCVLMCQTAKKEYYKKFLFEALPVESHVDHFLHDHLVSEIVTSTIENKQDVVDYLTWTFYYRRLVQNPNYYGMQGSSHRHISDHLSELAESTLSDLENSKVIAVEKEYNLEATNLGMIAAYYYITYTTIEIFAASLQENTKMKGLLEILSHASEFSSILVRPGEDDIVKNILMHAPLALSRPKYGEPATKTNALLQMYFSRIEVGGDLAVDQRQIVIEACRIVQAIVDVLASSGWLNPTLTAMEMAQMITQGMWDKDSPLIQVPHIEKQYAKALAKQHGLESVIELVELIETKSEEQVMEILDVDQKQMRDIKTFCARYPDIDLKFQTVKISPDSGKKNDSGYKRKLTNFLLGIRLEFKQNWSVTMRVSIYPPFMLPISLRKKTRRGGLLSETPKRISCWRSNGSTSAEKQGRFQISWRQINLGKLIQPCILCVIVIWGRIRNGKFSWMYSRYPKTRRTL